MSTFVSGLYGTHLARPPRRWRFRLPRVAVPLAGAAGSALRVARLAVAQAPGVVGAGLVSFGAWLAWAPAGFVVAGAFLLLLDRRLAA